MSHKNFDYVKKLLPLIAYACVVIVVFGPTLLPGDGHMLFAPDVWRYHYYQKPFLWEQLFQGHIPFWNAYLFSGQPYLEHPQVTPWYPINIIYGLLPISYAISWSLAIHIYIALAGMYWLAKKFVHPMPAFIAGLSFGLSGYYFGRIYAGHMEIIAASAWIPWVVGAYIDLIKYHSAFNVVRASLLLSLQLFAGHQPVALYTLESIGLFSLLKSWEKKSLKPIFVSIGAVIVGLATAAVQLVPSQQFISQSIRALTLPDDWVNVAVPTVNNFIELIDPHLFYELLPKIPLGHEYGGYIGKLPLLFALITIVWSIRHRIKRVEVWWLITLCVFSLWVTLGNNSPIDLFSFMRSFVPFYSEFRIPSRHIILFVFAASLLSAMAIQKIKNKKIQYVIALLVLLDLVPMFRHDVRLGDVPETKQDASLVKFLQKDTTLFRYLPDFYHADFVRENFEFDTPMKYGIYSVSGYDQPALRNYTEFLMAVHNVNMSDIVPYIETIPPFQHMTSPYVNFLNIKYIFIPTSTDPPLSTLSDTYKLVLDKSESGYRLYENMSVLPRFYMVSKANHYKNHTQVLEEISKGQSDPSTTVLLEDTDEKNSTVCSRLDMKPVEVLVYESSKIVLKTNNNCDGYLVSSEVNYPGWTATVDNKKAQVTTGNGAFRTVFVPKGDHIVTMTYIPTLFFISMIISLMLLLGSIVILLKSAPLTI